MKRLAAIISVVGLMALTYCHSLPTVNADSATLTVGSGANGVVREASWSSPSNITADDTSYAVVGVWGRSGDDESNNLNGTQFGFSIPAGATIDGVEVAIGKFYQETGDPGGSAAEDYVVQLLIAGTPSGNNKSLGADLNKDTLREDTYGGATDTWGLSLSPSDINATNFGLAYATYQPGGSGDESDVSVDYMTITVHYTDAAAGDTDQEIWVTFIYHKSLVA